LFYNQRGARYFDFTEAFYRDCTPPTRCCARSCSGGGSYPPGPWQPHTNNGVRGHQLPPCTASALDTAEWHVSCLQRRTVRSNAQLRTDPEQAEGRGEKPLGGVTFCNDICHVWDNNRTCGENSARPRRTRETVNVLGFGLGILYSMLFRID
jgi:hypothetical protein